MAKALGEEDTTDHADEYAFYTSWKSYPKYNYIWLLLKSVNGVLGVLFSCICLLDSLLLVFWILIPMEKTKEEVNRYV